MRDPECSQWFQCRVRRYWYRRSDLYASCGTSGTTCGSYTIHRIRKNALPGTLGKGSCFCILFLLCLGHFRSLITFQTAGRNIADVIWTTVICVNDPAPDSIYRTCSFQLIILKNLSYNLSVLLAGIIQDITVLCRCNCICKFIYDLRITEHAVRNITDDLVLTFLLEGHLAPAIVTDCNSFKFRSQDHRTQLCTTVSRIGPDFRIFRCNIKRITLRQNIYCISRPIIDLKLLRCFFLLCICIQCCFISQYLCWYGCREKHRST